MGGDLDQLTRLLRRKDWSGAQVLCEELLQRGDLAPGDLVTLHQALCRARAGAGDYHGAISPGLMALQLSRDCLMWDTAALLFLAVGRSQLFVRQFEQALTTLYAYFEHRPHFSRRALALEGQVWMVLSEAYEAQGDHKQAIWALERAKKRFLGQRSAALLFQSINALVRNACRAAPEKAPYWLRESLTYAWRHRRDQGVRAQYQLHKAAYMLATGQHRRGLLAGQRAIHLGAGDLELEFRFQLLQAEAASAAGDRHEALARSTAARKLALRMRRSDLEHMAVRLTFGLLRSADGSPPTDYDYLAADLDVGLDGIGGTEGSSRQPS